LDFVELEYGVPAGLLRPKDSMKKLLEPVSTRNPFRWLVNHVAAGARSAELNRQLAKRMDQYGTRGGWARIQTIDDLMRAWCGQGPEYTHAETVQAGVDTP
jgi:hypothetical protein